MSAGKRQIALGAGVLLLGAGCAQPQLQSVDSDSVRVSPVYRAGTPAGTASGQFAIGRIDLADGRIEAAIVRFKNALALDPQHLEAINSLGVAYGTLGKLQEAAAAFRQGLARSPDNALLLNNLAYALFKSRQFEEASVLLDHAAAVDPANVQTRENLGLLARARDEAESRSARAEVRDAAVEVPVKSVDAAASQPAVAPSQPDAAPSQVVAAAALEPASSESDSGQIVEVSSGVYELRLGPSLKPVHASSARNDDLLVAERDGRAPTSPSVSVVASPTTSLLRSSAADGAGAAQQAAARPAQAPVVPVAQRVDPIGGPDHRASRMNDVLSTSANTAALSRSATQGVRAQPLQLDAALGGVEVSNGVGELRLASRTAKRLSRLGVEVSRVSDYLYFGIRRTEIQYRGGHQASADALRRTLPVNARLTPSTKLPDGINVRLVIGQDLPLKRIAVAAGDEQPSTDGSAAPGVHARIDERSGPIVAPQLLVAGLTGSASQARH